jgi:hypothetical protein
MKIEHLLIGLALFAAPALAAEPVRPVLPYAGHLDQDGVPYDGLLQVRFSLYVAENGGDPPVFEEVQPSVAVRNGAFSVRIGDPDGQQADAAALAAVLEQDRQYWLEVSVRAVPGPGEDPPWTTLRHRQAVHAAAQALWTSTATDLRARTLTLTGALTADSLQAGAANLSHVTADSVDARTASAGTATIGDTLTARRIQLGDELQFTDPHGARITYPNAGAGDSIEIRNHTNVNDGLRVTGSLPGRSTLEVDGSADVGQNLTVHGTTELRGPTTIDTLQFTLMPQISSPGNLAEACIDGPPVASNACFQVITLITGDGGYCWGHSEGGNWRFCSRGSICTFGCLRIRP